MSTNQLILYGSNHFCQRTGLESTNGGKPALPIGVKEKLSKRAAGNASDGSGASEDSSEDSSEDEEIRRGKSRVRHEPMKRSLLKPRRRSSSAGSSWTTDNFDNGSRPADSDFDSDRTTRRGSTSQKSFRKAPSEATLRSDSDEEPTPAKDKLHKTRKGKKPPSYVESMLPLVNSAESSSDEDLNDKLEGRQILHPGKEEQKVSEHVTNPKPKSFLRRLW